MRAATVLRRMLGVSRTSVLGVSFEVQGLVVEVAPGNRRPRCGHCGRRAPGHDTVDVRDWRIRPVNLSAAHNSSCDLDADLDVGELGQSAPEHRVARTAVVLLPVEGDGPPLSSRQEASPEAQDPQAPSLHA